MSYPCPEKRSEIVCISVDRTTIYLHFTLGAMLILLSSVKMQTKEICVSGHSEDYHINTLYQRHYANEVNKQEMASVVRNPGETHAVKKVGDKLYEYSGPGMEYQ